MGITLKKDEISQKIDLLENQEKKRVVEFIDFLLSKHTKKSNIEEILLNSRVWSEEDIQEIEYAGKEFSKWEIENF